MRSLSLYIYIDSPEVEALSSQVLVLPSRMSCILDEANRDYNYSNNKITIISLRISYTNITNN